MSFDNFGTGVVCFHTLNLATTLIQVTDYITHTLFGSNNLKTHYRFHQSRSRLNTSTTECTGCTNFKRKGIRVNRMEFSVKNGNLKRFQWSTHQHTGFHCIGKAFFNCGQISPWQSFTLSGINKLQTTCPIRISRRNFNDNTCIVTFTTSLFLILFTQLYRTNDCLFVANLRTTLVALYTKFTTQTVNNNVNMEFTHT